MLGQNTIIVNHETMIEALNEYFFHRYFHPADELKLRVVSVMQSDAYDHSKFTLQVQTVDITSKDQAEPSTDSSST